LGKFVPEEKRAEGKGKKLTRLWGGDTSKRWMPRGGKGSRKMAFIAISKGNPKLLGKKDV